MADPLWQKSLEQILGSQNVTTAPEAIRRWDWEGSLPRAVAFPDSREQVCELMRVASAERLKVVPFGRGSKLRLGGVPQRVDFAISLEGLNQVLHLDARVLFLKSLRGRFGYLSL